jgi:CubicO group peptidase (beta-lactamase class C family)
MITKKRLLKIIAVYLAVFVAATAGFYFFVVVYGQKTFYLDNKQWHPAEPETQHINPTRLTMALDYVDRRLPTARSLLLLRNGKTVAEKYYWQGGPKATDYLHSMNLPLLQVLIGIAIDHQLIRGSEQLLSAFFPKHLTQTPAVGTAPLMLSHLLRAQAPLIWNAGNSDYWDLFYAKDRIEASLRVISRQQKGIQPAINFASAYLLSQAIEQVSGQSIFDFAYRYLFQPLGITTYAADDDDLPNDPMVGFQLKALDLAKIGYLLAQEGVWDGQRIVSKKWVRRLFAQAPHAEFGDVPGGSWVKTTIRGYESLVARGDGGQYLVLVPALHVVVVTTSTSRFPLPQDNGRDRLLQLIIEAVQETSTPEGMMAKPELKSGRESGQSTDIFAPNYVFSTTVPQEILDFFHQFSQDIVSKDRRRIAANYARAYEFKLDGFGRTIFDTPAPVVLSPSPPKMEYIHITKIRVENNRAYLRGTLKFDFQRMFAGLDGVWPLENLIKLKGRWKWIGLTEKTALLDRDDYFDAELSEEQQRFVDDCAGPLVGESSFFGNDCFAETFQLAGGDRELFAERLQPFLQGRSGVQLHVTGMQPNGAAYQVQGYIVGSALGELRLPDDLYVVKENGAWKWQGIVDSKQAE